MLRQTLFLFWSSFFIPFSIHAQTRYFADTVGFASRSYQMDWVVGQLQILAKASDKKTRVVICPHDDYAYAAKLYPLALQDLSKTPLIFIIGVAHKAKNFRLKDQIIFDSYPIWHAPYSNISIPDIRQEIFSMMERSQAVVHDSMQAAEHSVEAMLPFLQYFNPKVQVVSILVPYMEYTSMQQIASKLAKAIHISTERRKLKWGEDFAILISNDAVHYGDEGWGEKNFSYFGSDSAGYDQALEKEKEIINQSLLGNISEEKVKIFTDSTVQAANYKEYKWTWCGRYSVPFGLLTGYYLSKLLQGPPPFGQLIRYSTSIKKKKIPVEKVGLGVTAPANIRHWVGYVVISYY